MSRSVYCELKLGGAMVLTATATVHPPEPDVGCTEPYIDELDIVTDHSGEELDLEDFCSNFGPGAYNYLTSLLIAKLLDE